jgi:hypothetical protein
MLHAVAKKTIMTLRADISKTAFEAAWVSSSRAMYEPTIWDAEPFDQVAAPVTPDTAAARVGEAVTWLVSQLNRPILRYDWLRDGQLIAAATVLADTGRPLTGSGDPNLIRDTETADAVRQIRP